MLKKIVRITQRPGQAGRAEASRHEARKIEVFVVRCLQCCEWDGWDDVAVLLCRVVLFAVGYVFKAHRGTSSIGHPPHSSASPVELRLRVGPARALSGKKKELR